MHRTSTVREVEEAEGWEIYCWGALTTLFWAEETFFFFFSCISVLDVMLLWMSKTLTASFYFQGIPIDWGGKWGHRGRPIHKLIRLFKPSCSCVLRIPEWAFKPLCKCALVLLVIDSTLMLYLLARVFWSSPTQLMMAWSMPKVSLSKPTPEWDKVRSDRRAQVLELVCDQCLRIVRCGSTATCPTATWSISLPWKTLLWWWIHSFYLKKKKKKNRVGSKRILCSCKNSDSRFQLLIRFMRPRV